MGFFKAFGRVLAGKPVYTPEDIDRAQVAGQPDTTQPGVSDAVQPGVTLSGAKEIPQLGCGRIEHEVHGSKHDIYIDIENRSSQALFVDNIDVLGQHYELDSHLRPGERRQFWVYSGPPLMSAPSGYAQIQYRIESNNDYFMARFQIRARQAPDRTFRITEFRPAGPVVDLR